MSKFTNLRRGFVASLATAGAAAQAAVPAEIAAASTDALAVAAALTTLAVAVWGAMYLKKKFFGK